MSNAKWINIPGVAIRRTLKTETLSCDLDAASSEADDVASVDFVVWKGSTQLLKITKTAREMRKPNFSSRPSRLPGVEAGSLAPNYCWGITLDCNTLPVGLIEVSAEVTYSIGGTIESLPRVFLLNDSDGVDRRYNSQTFYVNAQTGNDSNSGSAGSPVRTINKALQLLGPQAGGGTVICQGNFVGVGPSLTDNWTTQDQYVTIRFLPGSTYTRHADEGNNYIVCSGIANIRIQDMDCRGLGMIFHGSGWPTSTARFTVWGENCEQHSQYWSPSGPQWSANHLRDIGEIFAFSGVTEVLSSSRSFLTSFLSKGAAYGPPGISGIYDFIIEDYIGIALQSVGQRQGDMGMNGIIRAQRARHPEVKGFINCRGGSNFQISQPAAGQLKITATGTVIFADSFDFDTLGPIDIADQLTEIVGSDYWWINLENFGSHSGRHQVLSVGHDPDPYIVLDYPGAVTPGTAPSSARIRTIRDNGSPYDPHPDLLQYLGVRLRPFHKNIHVSDVPGSQGWFVEAQATDLVLINVTDGGRRSPMGGDGNWLKNAIFQNVSFRGSWDFATNDLETSGCIARECVISNITNPRPGFTFRRCHFINPAQALGTSPTTGAFFADSEWTPLASRFNQGELTTCPVEWQWPGSANSPNTQGVFSNVGRALWGVSGNSTLSITSTASSSSAMAMAMAKALSMTSVGSSSETLTLGVQRGFLIVDIGISSSTFSFARLVPLTLSSSAGSSGQFDLKVALALSLQSLGASTSSFALSLGGVVDLTLTSSASSNTFMDLQVLKPPAIQLAIQPLVGETKSEMKQRIYNALRALVTAGPYYACSTDKKGQMTIDLNKPVTPTGVAVREIRSSYRPMRLNKRSFGGSEMEAWTFVARVEFPNTEVSCESFEMAVTDTGIKIPKVVGIDSSSQRSLLARLSGADYTHPPEQSPNVGTFADFTFEIVTELLRK